jgi:hypothetical protein
MMGSAHGAAGPWAGEHLTNRSVTAHFGSEASGVRRSDGQTSLHAGGERPPFVRNRRVQSPRVCVHSAILGAAGTGVKEDHPLSDCGPYGAAFTPVALALKRPSRLAAYEFLDTTDRLGSAPAAI